MSCNDLPYLLWNCARVDRFFLFVDTVQPVSLLLSRKHLLNFWINCPQPGVLWPRARLTSLICPKSMVMWEVKNLPIPHTTYILLIVSFGIVAANPSKVGTLFPRISDSFSGFALKAMGTTASTSPSVTRVSPSTRVLPSTWVLLPTWVSPLRRVLPLTWVLLSTFFLCRCWSTSSFFVDYNEIHY